MKKQTEKKLPDLQLCKADLNEITRALYDIDLISQRFLELGELYIARRLALNDSARTLKRELIFAQKDLWNLLTIDDRINRVAELNDAVKSSAEDGEYVIHAEWKKKKSRKKKTSKKK